MLLAPAAVLLVYSPVLSYQYVWDDLTYFKADSIYRDPSQFWHSLSHAFPINKNYFRPLTVLTFLWEMRNPHLDPALSHGINLLFHGLNVLLVGLLGFFVLQGGEEKGLWPVALALFYGFHATLAETVAFVSSRFDLMMTSFLLLALAADFTLKGRKWLRVGVVSLLFFSAALCKETAVCLLLILPLWRLLTVEAGRTSDPMARVGWKSGLAPMYGGLFAAGLAYLLLRRLCMGYILILEGTGALDAGSPSRHLLLIFKSLGRYAALTFFPFTLVRPIHFTLLPVPAHDWQAWLSMGLAAGALALWISHRKTAGVWPLWFVLPALPLLPVLNLVPLSLTGGAFAADRYLTLPLALFTLGIGASLQRLTSGAAGGDIRMRRLPPLLILGCALFSAALVRFSILPHWQNEMALWTWAEDKSPESPLPHTNLAGELCSAGSYQEGLEEANAALAADPSFADALSNQGVALMGLGRLPEAIVSWEKSVSLRSNDAVLWTNLAAVYRNVGRYDDSIRALRDHALVLDPRDGYALMNLGLTYLASGDRKLARSYLEKSIPLLPPEEAAGAQTQLEALSVP